MLCSTVIKERLYIGEATVATICGIIFGPHAAGLIDPGTWGNTDQITLEFSRIVLVVQCFAVGVELPRSYMERHWRSVTFLLIPVMTFGWLATSLFIWWMFMPRLNWLDSLCCAACVTATDPVLASSVVGKGKFAKRVPKHLRDLLSAESGCNDGMAFPFIYLALYLIRYRPHADKVAFHWICYTILYECIFGAIFGVCVGYVARRAIRYAHERDLIDRESFLVFYFVLALFCAGAGSILGVDDLLVGFACGVGFSNDGWFQEKTEESHVSNVIDLLINLAFFVYFGTIIPWAQFNSDIIGTAPWRLIVVGILVLFFRRIPIMLALKPVIPDIKTWREALFAGHFGPIGVGAIFVAILARAELETESTTPLAVLPERGFEHMNIIELIWPITTFLVICSIIVHGSSIAVFTLGKHINTLTLTLSYTQANEEGPSWMERLPRIQSRSKSMSMRRQGDESSMDEKDEELGPIGIPDNFLRRQREDEQSSRSSSLKPPYRRRRWDANIGPGGPISQSAIAPQARNRDHSDVPENARRGSDTLAMNSDESPVDSLETEKGGVEEPEGEVYREGDKTIIEDEEGNVLKVMDSKGKTDRQVAEKAREEGKKLMAEKNVEHGVAQTEDDERVDEGPKVAQEIKDTIEHPIQHFRDMRKRMESFSGLKKREEDGPSTKTPKAPRAPKLPQQKRGPALAYQFGNTIIVEDEDGEVLKKYDIPNTKKADRPNMGRQGTSFVDPTKTRARLQRMGTALGIGNRPEEEAEAGPSTPTKPQEQRRRKKQDDDDDEDIRFTITAGGQRMSKAEFIRQIQRMDPKSRARLVEESNAPEAVKQEARADAQEDGINRRKAAQQAAAEALPAESTDPDAGARVRQVGSQEDAPKGPEGLALVDSNDEDIPFHSVTEDIARLGGETAAQRRRRLVSPQREGSGYFTFAARSEGSARGRPQRASTLDEGETAVERRRREDALGHTKEESSEDEEGERARNNGLGLPEPPPQARGGARPPGITFADPPRTSRLRWGDDVVRKDRR